MNSDVQCTAIAPIHLEQVNSETAAGLSIYSILCYTATIPNRFLRDVHKVARRSRCPEFGGDRLLATREHHGDNIPYNGAAHRRASR